MIPAWLRLWLGIWACLWAFAIYCMWISGAWWFAILPAMLMLGQLFGQRRT